jgi:hypothetical protein
VSRPLGGEISLSELLTRASVGVASPWVTDSGQQLSGAPTSAGQGDVRRAAHSRERCRLVATGVANRSVGREVAKAAVQVPELSSGEEAAGQPTTGPLARRAGGVGSSRGRRS